MKKPTFIETRIKSRMLKLMGISFAFIAVLLYMVLKIGAMKYAAENIYNMNIPSIIYTSALFIACVFFMRFLACFIIPELHNIYKQMKNCGDKVESVIQAEIEDLNRYCIASSRQDYVLKTYTICTSGSFGVCPTKDLLWAYSDTRSSSHGIKIYYVRLKFRGDKSLSMVTDNNTESMSVILKISKEIPIVIGNNSEIRNLYKHDKNKFMELYKKAEDDFYKCLL